MGVANRRFSLIFIIGGMQIDFKCLALAVSTNPSKPPEKGEIPPISEFEDRYMQFYPLRQGTPQEIQPGISEVAG